MTTSEPVSAAVDHGVDLAAITERVNRAIDQTLTELKSLVAIPGIAWEAFDAAELDRSAEAV
ncbi:MAG: dipeptidase, partial [Micrococcaceae bacterium]|nr:dipeptidase [Micrococcaceae bacterium]